MYYINVLFNTPALLPHLVQNLATSVRQVVIIGRQRQLCIAAQGHAGSFRYWACTSLSCHGRSAPRFFPAKVCEREAKIKANVQIIQNVQNNSKRAKNVKSAKDHLASLFLPTVVTTEALFAQACRSAGTGPSLSDRGS